MNGPQVPVTEDEIQAYVDGRLPDDRRADVESLLAAQPEEAARVACYRRQNELLRHLLADGDGEPMPARLSAATRPPRRWRRLAPWTARVAAGLLLLALGAGGGWLLRGSALDALAELPRLATAAHRLYTSEQRHPVEVAASEQTHLVTWLSNRLGTRIIAPDLSAQGFRLIGGRLLPAGAAPAAQLMYESADGRRITCFITADPDLEYATYRVAETDGLTALYWRAGPLGYALVGEVDRDTLAALARSVDRQLRW